jgi:hypothetical protein
MLLFPVRKFSLVAASLMLFLAGFVVRAHGQTVLSGTYTGQTITGDISVLTATAAAFDGGTTFTGSNATIANNAQLWLNQDDTLSGKSLTVGSSGAYGSVIIGNGYSLTLDSTTTVSGTFTLFGVTSTTLINQGAIHATSGTSSVSANNLTNQGALTASGGAILNFNAGSSKVAVNTGTGVIAADGTGSEVHLTKVDNNGTINASNGGTVVFEQAWTTADLGTVNVASGSHAKIALHLDNTGATLAANTGVFEIWGDVTGGTVLASGVSLKNAYLNNVVFTGDVNVDDGAVTFYGGSSFSGSNVTVTNGSTFGWDQDSTLNGKTFTMGSASSWGFLNVGNSSNLTLGATTSVSGQFFLLGGSITNQGSIMATTGMNFIFPINFNNQGTVIVGSGATLQLGDTSSVNYQNSGTIAVSGGEVTLTHATLVNSGTIDVQSGTLYTDNLISNQSAGIIKGSGTISGGLTLGGGTLAPGSSLGTLTMTSGGFTVTGTSTLAIEISGTNADKIVFVEPGTINIGSGLLSLSLSLLSAPVVDTNYTLMEISSGGSGISGYFAGLQNSGDIINGTFAANSYAFQINYLGDSIMLKSVPEPETYAMLSLGLGLLALRRWKSRPAASDKL